MKHDYAPRPETDTPFRVAPKGAWTSWAVMIGGLSAAFTAGVWATNLSNHITALEAKIADISVAQNHEQSDLTQMREDVSWLVHESKGGHRGPEVSANP